MHWLMQLQPLKHQKGEYNTHKNIVRVYECFFACQTYIYILIDCLSELCMYSIQVRVCEL